MKLAVAVLGGALLMTSAAMAQSQYQSNCRSVYSNGRYQMVCNSSYGDTRPNAREEVYYQVRPPTAQVRPADPNLCGRGFRYTAADGCVAVRR